MSRCAALPLVAFVTLVALVPMPARAARPGADGVRLVAERAGPHGVRQQDGACRVVLPDRSTLRTGRTASSMSCLPPRNRLR